MGPEPRADALDLDTRRAVYQRVLRYPGLHLSELTRAFDVAPTTVRYHLDQLTREGLLTRVEEGGYARYYARVEPEGAAARRDALGRHEKRVLALLRQRVPLGVVLHLLAHDEDSQGGIAEAVGVAASTLSHHLTKLRKAGVVDGRREGRRTVYSLTDPVRVGDLVYGTEHTRDLADQFVELFEELGL